MGQEVLGQEVGNRVPWCSTTVVVEVTQPLCVGGCLSRVAADGNVGVTP